MSDNSLLETIAAYDYLIKRLSNTIRGLKIYPKVFTAAEHKYLHQFFDKNLYNALCLQDLIIGLKYLDGSQAMNNQLEANYFARIVAHNSHEILDDLNKLVGKDLRNYIIEHYDLELLEQVDSSIKSLNSIKKENSSTLKEIRNNLFGHKLKDGIKQAEMMMNVKHRDIYNIGDQILKAQIELLGNVIELIKKI